MYKNGDPKKKVAKADATSVTTSRYYPRIDQPLESSNNLFNNKGLVKKFVHQKKRVNTTPNFSLKK